MKSLKQFILEATESKSKGFIINTKEETYKYFDVTPDSEAGKLINNLFDIAPVDSNTGKIISPFVGNYDGKNNAFALRRWVKNNPETLEMINKINIKSLFNTPNKKFIFNNYHNTKLEDIDNFPNSTDQEYILALSLNIKSLGDKNINNALKYALFGDTDKELNEEENELFDKYLKYYNENKDLINNYNKNYELDNSDSDKPELFTKCRNSEVKKDVTDQWKENGKFNKAPSNTPKTDLKSNKGKNISVKKSDDTQAMSGAMNETMATLMTYANLLEKDDQKKLKQLFYDENGNEIDWKGNNKERNKKLNSIIKNIFAQKEKNKKFILAVLTESITGAGKFGSDSLGTAKEILVWSPDGEMHSYDVEKYIYSVFKHISEKDITINHKSSNSTYACMRLGLPSHEKIKDTLNKYSKEDADKDLLELIRSIRSNDYHKKCKNDEKDSEAEKATIKDDTGKEVEVIIHKGPEGGLFYYQPGKPKNDDNKVYIDKDHDGRIIPRKSK